MNLSVPKPLAAIPVEKSNSRRHLDQAVARPRCGDVSFVIRTYNEEKFLGRLLEVIAAQEGQKERPQIIVVDSGSTDRTVEIAKSWRVNLLEIPKAEFNYSRALNLGIGSSCGEFIAVLSAHAIPRSNDWLARMLSHFKTAGVAGVCCRETPWPDADWREVLRLRTTFGEQTRVYDKSSTDLSVTFSNAASCIRRTVWEEHPFVVMPYAEDREWARWALANGYKIVYEANAVVYHSHNETCRQAARRLINIEKANDLTEGRRRTLLLTARQAGGLVYRDIRAGLQIADSKRNHLALLRDSIARGYWFMHDFKIH